jgi:glycosyltransferase involved in cell wall biosynthesis
MQNVLTHNYSNKIYNKKILIIAPYPPPLGGVAIHIKRVKSKLEGQNNLVEIYNTAIEHKSKVESLTNLIKKLWSSRPDIIYYHEPTESIQKLAVVTGIKKFLKYKLTVIDHDCRSLYKFSKSKKAFFKSLVKKADKIILIGDTTDRCYRDNKITLGANSIESPFLPPDMGEEKTIVSLFPTCVHKFMEKHRPIITATAFVPALYDKKDLYGFDMCIELIQTLKKDYPDIGLLFGICKIETDEQKKYFEIIKKRILDMNLQENFYFFIDKNEFWPIIKRSDLFVRPTRSDSFGISIQEALSVGTPAIASNVCLRPEGTVLFSSGDIDSLVEKTREIL